jgi:hexulose-6-phosphate isomerase
LEFRDFVDKFNSEYVEAYFDVGNVLLTGYPEHWIRILNKRIKKVHIKDFRTSVGNVNGFVDLLPLAFLNFFQ